MPTDFPVTAGVALPYPTLNKSVFNRSFPMTHARGVLFSSAIAFTLATFALVPSGAQAMPFDASLVSEEAKFVLFVDVEAAKKTVVGETLLKQITSNPDYAAFEQILIDIAGFMPAEDIADFTIWGDEIKEGAEAAIVIRAKYDAAALRGGLSLAQDFKAEKYADHELLNWHDGKKSQRVHACLFEGKFILISNDAEKLKQAVDVLRDPARSIEGKDLLGRPAQATSWAFASGIDLSKAPQVAENPVLSQMDSGVMEVGESDGKTVAVLTAKAATAEAGEQLFNMANGVRALGILAGKPRRGQPEPELRAQLASELAGMTRVSRDGATVSATLSMDNERAQSLLDEMIAQRAGQNLVPDEAGAR
jgi:hypothetical protein